MIDCWIVSHSAGGCSQELGCIISVSKHELSFAVSNQSSSVLGCLLVTSEVEGLEQLSEVGQGLVSSFGARTIFSLPQ